MKNKNIGLIIVTVIIVTVVVATAAVSIFAGAVALFGYIGETESETVDVQESEAGSEGNQSGDEGSQGGSEGNETVTTEEPRDEAEFTQTEIDGVEIPEEE